jgi:hypothetical protein
VGEQLEQGRSSVFWKRRGRGVAGKMARNMPFDRDQDSKRDRRSIQRTVYRVLAGSCCKAKAWRSGNLCRCTPEEEFQTNIWQNSIGNACLCRLSTQVGALDVRPLVLCGVWSTAFRLRSSSERACPVSQNEHPV